MISRQFDREADAIGRSERQKTEPILANLQDVIDAIPESVAIIAPGGTILIVNETWRLFCRSNGGDSASYYVGANYLKVCHDSNGEAFEYARDVETGLLGVFAGANEFSLKYPCHSSKEQRWFLIVARPLEIDGERHVMILHQNVTEAKHRELEATQAKQNAINLESIVTALPDAVIGLDLKGRITSWNDAAKKLYGYERSEAIGQSIRLLFPPDWQNTVEEYIAKLISQDQSQFEVIRQTKSGQRRRIEITAAPIKSPSGDIVGLSNINRDITEKRMSELRLRNILNNLFAFVGILETDGTLIEANRAPLEAAGLAASDVIGQNFWDCYWWNYSPEVQRELQEACSRARKGELVRYDVQVRVAGGQLIWIDFQLAPLLDEDGRVENLIPSGIDISERKAALEALRTSHDSFSALVQRSPFGIYTVDADFRLANVSDGAQKVFSNVRPLIGRDFAEILRILWPEPFASEAIDRFRHTLASGEPYRSPSTVERRSDIDEVESYDWTIERTVMPDGRPGVVCNFYDLSERQRQEEHIRFLMQEVNHRSKNLLSVVISMARQTARDCSPQEFVKDFSHRLLGLSASHDLIVQGNWGGVTADALIRSQLKHLSQEVHSNRVKTDGPDLLLTPAAAQGIGMALHELSTNAIKYGSLSVLDGTVSIDWGTNTSDRTFFMRWKEQGGPPVTPPQKNGFGRTVIEKMAATSAGGHVHLEYPESGAVWILSAPIGRIIKNADEISA